VGSWSQKTCGILRGTLRKGVNPIATPKLILEGIRDCPAPVGNLFIYNTIMDKG
jgi:hypothetical protein